jgi:hypothetical protein
MNTSRIDRMSARFLEAVLVVTLCLIGVFPLAGTLISWFGFVAAEAPRPIDSRQFFVGLGFFIATVLWYAGIAWLIRYFLRKKGHGHVS